MLPGGRPSVVASVASGTFAAPEGTVAAAEPQTPSMKDQADAA
jgi:hypothetical protein